MFQDPQLAILGHLVSRFWLPGGGVLLLVALAILLYRHVHRTPRTAQLVVRKGVCPCCESALFGTTAIYQHLDRLNLVDPDSPYLCPTCDGVKVAALQRHWPVEHSNELSGQPLPSDLFRDLRRPDSGGKSHGF